MAIPVYDSEAQSWHDCPSGNCHGAFFHLRGVGMVCSTWLFIHLGTNMFSGFHLEKLAARESLNGRIREEGMGL